MGFNMMIRLLFACTLLIFASSIHTVQAQELGNSDDPIEISADNSLEWQQKQKQYVANGNVIVTQGTNKIFADQIIADYRENETTGNTEIWQLTALENVRLENDANKATANKATYNIDTGLSTLTGGNLKLTLPDDQTITAQERMEYNINEGVAKAIGNAKIKRGVDTLNANTITAYLTKDSNGKQKLKTAKANGRVQIKTADETVTGDKANYNAINNTAEMMGNVKIKRGSNILEGDRAQVNLNTNISKIFGNANNGKRVKGVFFPSSRPKKEEGQ